MQNVKQRTNNASMNREYLPAKKASRRSLNSMLRIINWELKRNTDIPENVNPAEFILVKNMMSIATRDNLETPSVFCAHCQSFHTDDKLTIKCPKTGHNLKLKIPNVSMEKNTLSALTTVWNKMYPNLASVTSTVNIRGEVSSLSSEIVKIILEYVPFEKREECGKKLNDLILSYRELDDE